MDEPLPPPAWLVGGIVATVIFVATALIAALPREQPAPRTEPAIHSGIVEAGRETDRSATFARTTPVPFDPINLSLPIL
jgi:hypothetical protein